MCGEGWRCVMRDGVRVCVMRDGGVCDKEWRVRVIREGGVCMWT